ncbi:dormancy-associated protein homolog 4-like [Typha angustifolia]|uniref:dormancy-associated protein homolog 4-like n=1 Tax=Typha angustifolia TaxID=59011 RepID=UPI003C2B752A
MGLLDHLWDDTVAGPPPESGLGKLRKYSSFSPSSASAAAAGTGVTVTRSITIVRTTSSSSPVCSPRSVSGDSSSVPSSPASVPDSPFAPLTPREQWRSLRRKQKPVAEGMETAEPRSPTVYDWVVISSLDR